MVRRDVLLLLLQQQQDELDDDGPSTRSPNDNEGRQRHDRWAPRPALRHPQLSPWTQLLNSANDQVTEFRQPLKVQSHLEMPRILVQLGHIQRT